MLSNIAIIMTCFNRREKTIRCLNSIWKSHDASHSDINYHVYLTNDGCTDGTPEAIKSCAFPFGITIIEGNGHLFWNAGMLASWGEAVKHGDYDGYLWLNDDTVVKEEFWKDLFVSDSYSMTTTGRHGIYVGSTCDSLGQFTYGGFDFMNRITLKDSFKLPNGECQLCHCGHGNITFVSSEVVDQMGLFCADYIHGGTDHDYTYLAHKAGIPVFVMPHYDGICENDHPQDGYDSFLKMSLRERISYLKSPFGFNLSNTLLFQKRCFPYRYPFVFIAGYLKALIPNLYLKLYRIARGK